MGTPSAFLLVVLSPILIFSLALIGCLLLDGINYLIHNKNKNEQARKNRSVAEAKQ